MFGERAVPNYHFDKAHTLFLLEQTLLVIGKEDLKKAMLLAETQTQIICLI